MSITVSNPVKLSFYQGDSVDFTIILQDDQAIPVAIDLTGSTIESILKEEFSSTTEYPFTIVETDLTNGTFHITMNSTDTLALPITGSNARKSFVFDIKVTYQSGLVETPIYGDMIVDRNRS